MRLIKLRNRVRQLGRQVTADADQDAGTRRFRRAVGRRPPPPPPPETCSGSNFPAIVKELARKNAELQQNADKLRELSPADASLSE